jgi:hypothetical protein
MDFTLLTNYGVAGIILAAILFALWRGLVWLAPHIERLIEAQIDFVNTTKAAIVTMNESLKNVNVRLDKMDEQLAKLQETSKQQGELLNLIHKQGRHE